ncbi:MAG: hypothetical protein ACM3L9_07530 [Deltaproteobacteria bacterium]
MSILVEDNPTLARIYARMPVDVQLSFTPEQIAALGQATYEPPTPHRVAIRKTGGFFGRRYYFALFMGRDRRGPEHGSAYLDQYRADWRYVASVLATLAIGAALISTLAFHAWHYMAAAVGGPYRPVAAEGFISRG